MIGIPPVRDNSVAELNRLIVDLNRRLQELWAELASIRRELQVKK